MTPKDLRDHKRADKRLDAVPTFKPLARKNGLPKPLDQLGRRKRAFSTGLIAVSDDHCAFFVYREGEILTDRAFYGYLFCRLANGSLHPLYEFHWHPSHKGIHCKMPCKTELNYSGRLLVHAPELNLKTARSNFDPADESDRHELMRLFCEGCGVTMTCKRPGSPQFRLGF